MSRCYVQLDNVTLRYPSSQLRTSSLKEAVFNIARRQPQRGLLQDVTALEGITFRVSEGDRLGIIGANGAGKTSLLKAIAGIYPLHSGVLQITGKVHSLFDLSLGFENDATGRENIVYRGLLMGEKPAHIRAKEIEIIEFADIGKFIDFPVKTYSAGMLVRLAFSISTAFGGDILLLDEVISAGDASFLQRARKRITGLVSRSRIMILVAHDLGAVQQMCNRVIRLDHGQIVDDGNPQAVIRSYLSTVEQAA